MATATADAAVEHSIADGKLSRRSPHQRVDLVVSDVNAIVAELEAVDALAGTPASGLRRLASLLTPFTARPGTTLMRKGEDGRLFCAPDGAAQVVNGDSDGHGRGGGIDRR